MTFSKLLELTSKALVLDNSVLVNLFASQCGASVLQCISNHVIVPDVVVDEFTRRPYQLDLRKTFIQHLVNEELVEIRDRYTEDETALFNLLTDDQISLGDGESMTISIAVCNNCIPVIDEEKGTEKARKLTGDSPIARSTDILMHSSVYRSFSDQDYADCVFRALHIGRMHVELEQRDSIVELIGVQRALLCNSLPEFNDFKRTIGEQSNT